MPRGPTALWYLFQKRCGRDGANKSHHMFFLATASGMWRCKNHDPWSLLPCLWIFSFRERGRAAENLLGKYVRYPPTDTSDGSLDEQLNWCQQEVIARSCLSLGATLVYFISEWLPSSNLWRPIFTRTVLLI